MPDPLKVDRHLFSALVLQGFTAVQVANKLNMNVGTARSWINRMGLIATKSRVKAALAEAHQPDLAVQIAQDAASRVRKSLGEVVERDLRCLKDAPASRTAKDLKARYAAIEPAVRIAEKVYGWDKEGMAPNHLSLTSITIAPEPTPEPSQANVIEDKTLPST